MTDPSADQSIEIRYFAELRDRADKGSERWLATEAMTARQLYAGVQTHYGFDLGENSLRVAINDEFAHFTDTVQPGDRVAFIPPVAGG